MADQDRHFDTDKTSPSSTDDGETSQTSTDDIETSQASGDGETSRSSTFAKHNPRFLVQGASSISSGVQCGSELTQTDNENDKLLRRRKKLSPRQPVIASEKAGIEEAARKAGYQLEKSDELSDPDQQRPPLFTYCYDYVQSTDYQRRRYHGTHSACSVFVAFLSALVMFVIYMCSPDSASDISEVTTSPETSFPPD